MSATDRALWFQPALGVAGDMVLATLLDLGAHESAVRRQLELLDLEGWKLEVGRCTRAGLASCSVTVEVEQQHHHRPWSTIDRLLAAAPLHPRVAAGARRSFEALGRAEAAVHDVALDDVHFHEVGALDAIVDIVGSWAALVDLGDDGGPPEVHSAPIGLGCGTAQMSHGELPVPAPAVIQLLRGLPVQPLAHPGESATPTGVALLTTMVQRWGPLPAGVIEAAGRGAGRRDPETHANVLSAVLVRNDGSTTAVATLLETNLDDVTPEVLAHVVDAALVHGADDAWITPIVMKKGRPAHLLSVLCSPERAIELRSLVAAETGTLGIRERRLDKHEAPRRIDEVDLDGHVIRIKVGPHGAKPEHDDVAAAAAATGRPLRAVAAEALAAWRASR